MFVLLKGGLGNLLYQYFYVHIKYKHRKLIFIDCTRSFLSFHEFELNKIINIDVVRPKCSGLILKVVSILASTTLFQYLGVIKEGIKHRKPVILTGYFQDTENIIRSNLTFEDFYTDEFIQAREKYSSLKNHIAVHVRRGDYIGSQHEVCEDDWYVRALEKVRDSYPDKEVICFSDDVEYCRRSKFSNLIDKYFIDLVPNKPVQMTDEFGAFSSCGYFIISNSTFAVWATLFAQSTAVYAPYYWFKGVRTQSLRIAHKSWIIVR